MKKTIWLKLFAILLASLMIISLFACENNPTGSDTSGEGGESESQSEGAEDTNESDVADESDSTPAENETDITIDYDSFEDGATVAGAGNSWEEEAFANGTYTIDEASAVEKTADEIKAMLADKSVLSAGQVFKVTEPLILDSNTKYYGNLAAIIATEGIVIKDASEIVIKELLLMGNVKIENSTGITLFKMYIESDGVAVSADKTSSTISVKSCVINAANTAVEISAPDSAIYQCSLTAGKAVVSSADNLAMQDNHFIGKSAGIVSSGASCIVKNNIIETTDKNGIGAKFTKGSYNNLVALNVFKVSNVSIDISEGYNCSIILNSAVCINATNNKNLYIVDNNLGGMMELEGNNYLICDGNRYNAGSTSSINVGYTMSKNNTNVNGDNMHDVDARLDVGADEDLLPHTNKDLFIGMERQSKIRDLTQPKSYPLNGYVRNMAKNSDVVIIPPGAYSVTSTLNIQAAHANTTVYAYGVYQEATKYIKNLDISSTSNFTIKGLTTGYSLISAGQIHILDKLGNNKFLVISSAGFGTNFGQLDTSVFSSGGYFFNPGSFTGFTEIGNWGKYTVVPNEKGEKVNEDGTFTIELGGKDAAKYYSVIQEGSVFACRLNIENDRTVSISNSKNVLLQDTVTYGYGDALCFVIGGTSTGVKFYRHHNLAHSGYEVDKETYDKYEALEEKYGVDLEMYVDEYGRYRGAASRIGSVDATHITGATQGLTAISTLFENSCDDASNQRGNSSCLHQIIDNHDGTLTLVYKDYLPETYLNSYKNQGRTTLNPGHNVSDFAKGDRIFIYASNGKVFCDATVLSATTTLATGYTIYEEDYKYNGEVIHMNWTSTLKGVTVRKTDVDMSAIEGYELGISSPKMETKIIVDNLSRNSVNFTFDNCMVRNNRGRFVVKTRDALITNCTFNNNSMAGVVMSCESSWGESSVPYNVTVTKCLFDGTSQTLNYENNTKYAAVAVEGLGSGGVGKEVNVTAETIPCKNITITNNVFRNVPNNYYVTVSAAQNVTIMNNVFESRSTDNAKKVGKAIYVNGCMDICISNNTYSEFANGDLTNVIVGNNYKNLYGTDVEGVFETNKEPETAN